MRYMSRKTKFVLTAVVVLVIVAIYVVGLFLLSDVFDFRKKLDELFEKDLYGKDYHPVSDTAVTLTFDGKAVTEQEEQLLGEYFTYFYAGLGELRSENIARFYTTQCIYELYDDLAFRYEAYLAGKCPIDRSYGECTVTVYVTRRHAVPKKADIEIDVEISASAMTGTNTDPIVVRGEKHSFVIDEDGKSPLIKEHTSVRPSYTAAMRGYDKVLAEAGYQRKDMNYTFIPKYTERALEMLKKDNELILFGKEDLSGKPTAECEYDRSTAALTAIAGFSDSGAFTEYDEDDANFVSRCIFEGGIPMDAQGDRYDQWKWYDEELNNARKKTGCSRSWYDREYFYRYVTTNEGFGMVAYETTAGNGELGDVIQLMQDDKPAAEFMITSIMVTKSGQVKDYLVSNDTYSAVSLISLGYTDYRVLHIAGFNTANI